MEKLGSLCGFLLLLVSWIVTKPVAGQLVPCSNCTVADVDNFLNDKEMKVVLLARHALFLQLAAESTDCGKFSHRFSVSFLRFLLFSKTKVNFVFLLVYVSELYF